MQKQHFPSFVRLGYDGPLDIDNVIISKKNNDIFGFKLKRPQKQC